PAAVCAKSVGSASAKAKANREPGNRGGRQQAGSCRIRPGEFRRRSLLGERPLPASPLSRTLAAHPPASALFKPSVSRMTARGLVPRDAPPRDPPNAQGRGGPAPRQDRVAG